MALSADGATKEEIAAAREFFKPSTVDDMAVVFFAGHGLRDKKLDYYFATADIDFADPASRGMPSDDIDGLLDGIGARRKLLLVDTCNSGELDKGRGQADGGARGQGRGRRHQLARHQDGGEDRADGAEFALESSEWKKGVFTYALLSTLAEGKSRVSELREATR